MRTQTPDLLKQRCDLASALHTETNAIPFPQSFQLTDLSLRVFCHDVIIAHCISHRTDLVCNICAARHIWHKMPIHHINVQQIHPRRIHFLHLAF